MRPPARFRPSCPSFISTVLRFDDVQMVPHSCLKIEYVVKKWSRRAEDKAVHCMLTSSVCLIPRGRVGSLDAHIKDSEDQLRRLQSSRTDELQAFGPLMRSLKEALRDNQQRFRKMPKGPVGSYIRLKDYKWSTAVEQVLKGVLFCFVVDNPYDDAEFKRLANGVFRRGSHSGNTPRIDTIISSFQVGCPGVMSCDVSYVYTRCCQ